jgi:uncharacterized spore protein YtfJ
MTEIEALLKATIGEMERLLASKTVIGEPITAEGKTVIPLLSVGPPGRGREEEPGDGRESLDRPYP